MSARGLARARVDRPRDAGGARGGALRARRLVGADLVAELAGRPRRDYVVAVDRGQILGYGGIDVSGDVADLMTIATAPEAQGRGMGRRLLDEPVRRAERSGAEALLLEVRADNEAAKRLYSTSGFEVTVRRRYYQPGDIDALVMRKHIEVPMADEPLVLGIETSVRRDRSRDRARPDALVDTVASSVDEHARFGGVVPEVASRAHLEAMVPTIERACRDAGVALRDLDAIAP